DHASHWANTRNSALRTPAPRRARCGPNPKKFREEQLVGTFGEVNEAWYKKHVLANHHRTAGEPRRVLNTYLVKWKQLPFLEVRRRQIVDLLDDVAERHGVPQSNRVLVVISSICKWY